MATIRHKPRRDISHFLEALPFWLSLPVIPVVAIGAYYGGWTVLLVPITVLYLYSAIDFFAGLNFADADINTPDSALKWYRMITVIWGPMQFVTIFGSIYYVTTSTHLGLLEQLGLFFGIGIMSGTIGIVYAHELMHQKPKWERWLGDILMSMALYSHFRSEHLLVHHRYVGTPRDNATARYNEGFHRFFPRVVIGSAGSAFRAERAMLARKGLHWSHRTNPYWRYAALQLAMLALAALIAGWLGVLLFVTQACVAIWQLELVNYMEHYGLTRRHLGDGRYEHAQPHHSWNSAHMVSNWLMINLQRHSDHHHRPDRRFPLLQNHGPEAAPQLPMGYTYMGLVAMVPPLWRRKMNPKVRAWRRQFYPDIEDWKPYNKARNPMPKGS